MKLGILKSFKEIDNRIEYYIKSCQELNIDFVVLNLLSENWLEEIKESKVDGILVRIKGDIQEQKSMYDERLHIINSELGIPIYPSRKELLLYENKRMCNYWMQINHIQHTPTSIFYTKADAIKFINKATFPLVFKTNCGAASSGVRIIRSKLQAKFILHKIFGIIDPRLSMGNTLWGYKKGILFPRFGNNQKHYVFIQPYIPHKWEWRVSKIGDSFFGLKKRKKGNFASGSGMPLWVEPPRELFELTKHICEVGQFDSMAVDILEAENGDFYVNEIQSLFGSTSPFQLRVNNKPGRYKYINNNWIFEEGEYNRFGSCLLRVEDFVMKLNNKYYNNKKDINQIDKTFS